MSRDHRLILLLLLLLLFLFLFDYPRYVDNEEGGESHEKSPGREKRAESVARVSQRFWHESQSTRVLLGRPLPRSRGPPPRPEKKGRPSAFSSSVWHRSKKHTIDERKTSPFRIRSFLAYGRTALETETNNATTTSCYPARVVENDVSPRCRKRETFLAEIQETEPLFLTRLHGRKSVGRLKKETRTCLRSEVGREGEREGGERGRNEVEKKLVVCGSVRFREHGKKITRCPPAVCMCVCQWFCRSNNRVRRSYVTIQATLLLVAYQSYPPWLKIDRSYDPWTRVILSLAFRLVSSPRPVSASIQQPRENGV